MSVPRWWLGDEDGRPPPGRAGFDVAARILESRVEPVFGDLMRIDLAALGRFDVVLFLGVLYHLEDPLVGMRRVAELTSGLAVIESHAMSVGDGDTHALLEFFPGSELNEDPTSWYVTNVAAIDRLRRAAGFTGRRRSSAPSQRSRGRPLPRATTAPSRTRGASARAPANPDWTGGGANAPTPR